MHIFDARFAPSTHWPWTPPDAPVAAYRQLQQRLGTSRAVVVTPSTYGTDNACTLDALGQLGDCARGVAVVGAGVSAEELSRHADPDGTVRHAEIRIGDSTLMLTDESPEWPEWKGPIFRGGTAVHLYLRVPDVDRAFAGAIAAGAKVLLPVEDKPYGERSGGITDPFGHVWYLSTPAHRKEAV